MRPKKVGDREIEHIRIREGWLVSFRFVNNPFMYAEHQWPIKAISPGMEFDACYQAGHRPTARYACWVIDRADGHMKVFDFGPKVYGAIKNWAELKKKSPGGPEGTDWLISFRMWPGEKRRQAEWQVVHDKPTPFTKAEKKMIEETVSKHPLAEIFKPATPEMIEKLWEEAKNRRLCRTREE